MLHIHIIQHVEHEGPGLITEWANESNIQLSFTRFYQHQPKLPPVNSFEALVILGGPMGVYDELPWLEEEKLFIQACILADKKILGICLGAQLIAEVSGAKVYPHTHREIGWWNVYFHHQAQNQFISQTFPAALKVLHWHGDTYDLPENATHLASSDACFQQAFSINNNKIIGLQFHLETTLAMIKAFCTFDKDVLAEGGTWVQSQDEILQNRNEKDFIIRKQVLFNLLNQWISA